MSTNDEGRGLDRRSALKTAAAAGAAAWVAPTISARTVHAGAGNTCTPKCRPSGSGSGSATASATCSGQGSSRRLHITVDLSAFQRFTCPCGGTPTVGVTSCSSNVGTCTVGSGGSVTVTYDERGQTGTLNFVITLTGTASCPDRSPDDGDCIATCSTRVSVSVNVENRGNCNGFPQSPTPQISTTCS